MNKTLVTVLVFIMLPLAGSGIDIYSPSLPSIQHYFSTSATLSKLTITLYLLGLGIGQTIFGTLSDIIGRKKTLIYGASGFIASSGTIILPIHVKTLLVCRLVQGLSAGSIAVNARSLVTDNFTKLEIKNISSYMSLAWSMGPIVAPLLGGLFEYYWSWKISFTFLIFYTLVILFMTAFIKDDDRTTASFKPRILRQHYKTILSHKEFAQAMLLMAIGYSILMSYVTILPFFVQTVLMKSALAYGNTTTLIGLSYLLGSIINRLMLQYMRIDSIFNTSLLMMLVLSLSMLYLSFYFPKNIVALYLPISLLTLCIAIIFPSCMSQCISLFPTMAGTASAISGAGFMLLGALSSSIISHLHLTNATQISEVFLVLVLLCIGIRLTFDGPRLITNPFLQAEKNDSTYT